MSVSILEQTVTFSVIGVVCFTDMERSARDEDYSNSFFQVLL